MPVTLRKTIMTRLNQAVLSGLGGVLIAAAFAAPAWAQSSPERQFGTAAGQIVVEAQDLAKAKNYGAGAAKLEAAIQLDGLSPYERATIHGMLGSFYYELDDLASAISNFEQAILSGGLSAEETREFTKHKALLMIGSGDYQEGARLLQSVVATPTNPCGRHAEPIYQAYIKAEIYEDALPCAEAWFAAASPKERKHYDLLNFLYHHTDRQGQQADLLKQMIGRWPDDLPLWNNWVSLLAQAGRDEDAFEVKKLLYLAGRITEEAEIKKVVEYYQYYDMPYQAGRIMEMEMNAGRVAANGENLVRLSELFRQAREYERAIPVLKKAAEITGRGKTWAQYGEALYNEGRCEQAEAAFTRAIDLGYDRGKSWMFVGNCWYESGQLERRPECDGAIVKDRDNSRKIALNDKALSYFKKVPVTAKNAGAARKWTEFVTAENDSFDHYCAESEQLRIDLCFMKIESAYKMEIIRGEFYLAPKDQYCLAYKDEYDNRYRRGI